MRVGSMLLFGTILRRSGYNIVESGGNERTKKWPFLDPNGLTTDNTSYLLVSAPD